MKLVAFLIVLISTECYGATWYVDNTASGANNGTSWPNAWTSFGAIVWGSVGPGDTIYVSGGSTSQAYNEILTFGKSGTSGNLITVKTGQDAGHNGVVMQNGYVDGRQNYVTISGNVGGAQHWVIRDQVNTNTSTFANCAIADNTTGFTMEYMYFTNVNNCIQIIGADLFRIAHCAGTDIRGDACVRAANSIQAGYDRNFVEYCDFEISRNDGSGPPLNGAPMVGPDGVQGSHSITVRYNRFRTKNVSYWTSYQHPDYTQLIGNYNKIYGNEFWDIGDSANDFDLWVNPTIHDIMIFSNLYRITVDKDPYPEFIRLYSSSATMVSITRFYIFNNTFIDNGWNNIRLIWKGNPAMNDVRIENNVFVNSNPYEIADNTSFNTSPIVFANNTYYPSTLVLSYRCAPGGGATACGNYTAASWSSIEPSRTVGLPSFVSYAYRAVGNDLHLTSGDTVAKDTGLDLSALGTVDKDGVVRTIPWDRGAYDSVGGTIPVPGSLSIVSATYAVSETSGTVNVTVRRSGGSSGPVNVSYATANGSAVAGVNYASASGAVNWSNGDVADKTVSVSINFVGFNGTKQFTLSLSAPSGGATLGSITTTTVSITGAGTPVVPLLPGLSWPATNGVVSAPFVGTNNVVVQNGEILDFTVSGRVSFTFTNVAGTYTVKALMNAPSDAQNSVGIDFNQEPTSPTAIWDVQTFTSGFEDRYASWRGTGAFNAPQFAVKTWFLPAGTNTLIIRGREANVQLSQITVLSPPGTLPPVTPTNVSPVNGSTNLAVNVVLQGSVYSDTNLVSSLQLAAEFRVLSASQTTILYDRFQMGSITNTTTQRLPYNKLLYWQVRYENSVPLWSEWSQLTSFSIKPGNVIQLQRLKGGQ